MVYIRRRYYRKSKDEKDNDIYEHVYDCMNSHGLDNPYPVVAANDKNIIEIFKVIVEADPLSEEDFRSPNIHHKNMETQTSDAEIYSEDII